jgi:hypothetical protein
MKGEPFRTGELRNTEWEGFWKAHPDDPPMTGDEWDEKWASLKQWLSQRYNLRPIPIRKRQCFVLDAYSSPERTLQIEVSDVQILTAEFLFYVQQWVRTDAPNWRVCIPTDDNVDTLILVYPRAVRINPEAEKDIEAFCHEIQPGTAAAMKRARRELGLDW